MYIGADRNTRGSMKLPGEKVRSKKFIKDSNINNKSIK